MIYHIDMTPEQHAWLVDQLKYEADPTCTFGARPDDSDDWLNMSPGRKQITQLDHMITHAPCFRPATDAERNAANRFDSSEVNIDTDAVIAAGPNGSGWVSAWIFIGKDDDDDE